MRMLKDNEGVFWMGETKNTQKEPILKEISPKGDEQQFIQLPANTLIALIIVISCAASFGSRTSRRSAGKSRELNGSGRELNSDQSEHFHTQYRPA